MGVLYSCAGGLDTLKIYIKFTTEYLQIVIHTACKLIMNFFNIFPQMHIIG